MPTYASWSRPEEYDFEYYDDGREVRLRPIGPEDLITNGALKYLDTMTSFVNEEHVQPATDRRRVPTDRQPKKLTAAQQKAKDVQDNSAFLKRLADNPEDFEKLSFVIDAVLVAGVVRPQLSSAYVSNSEVDGFEKLSLEERDPQKTYTDFIPFGERMSIFGELSKGLGDMKSLPPGSNSNMGALEAGEGLDDPA